MQPTAEQVRDWVGSDVWDAEGNELGRLVAAYLDDAGRPAWLSVLLADGAVPVPVRGAEPTGNVVRVAALGDAVRAAPRLDPDAPLPDALAAELAEHYGLRAPAAAPAHPEPPPQLDQAERERVVARLREAYALESEGLLRLQALTMVVDDEEIQHDATLHANETELHRTGVEERLAALDASPSTARDLAHGTRAAAAGLAEKLRGDPVAAVRDAEAFERREAAFYAELEELARSAGDTATADLAAAHRADEEAMAVRLAGALPRLDSPV